MKPVEFVSITALILAETAHAIIGVGVHEGGPSAICALTVITPMDGKSVFWEGDETKIDWDHVTASGFCSGTLTKEDEVTTAAHCVDALFEGKESKNSQVVVVCDYSEKSGTFRKKAFAKKVSIADGYFKSELESRNDAAKIILSYPMKEIVPISAAGKTAFQEVEKYESCLIAGAGTDNDGNQGKLYTVRIPTHAFINDRVRDQFKRVSAVIDNFEDFHRMVEKFPTVSSNSSRSIVDLKKVILSADLGPWNEFIQNLNRSFPYEGFLAPGDSGGALLCRKSKAEPFLLIGINQGGGISFTDQDIYYVDIWVPPHLPMGKEIDLRPKSDP